MGWCQVIQWLGDFSIDSPSQLHSRFIITKLSIRNDFLIRAHRGGPFAPLHKTTFVIWPRRISQSNVMDAWPQFNHSQADNLCWVFVRRVENDDWFLVWHISCAIRICFRFFRRFSPFLSTRCAPRWMRSARVSAFCKLWINIALLETTDARERDGWKKKEYLVFAYTRPSKQTATINSSLKQKHGARTCETE